MEDVCLQPRRPAQKWPGRAQGAAPAPAAGRCRVVPVASCRWRSHMMPSRACTSKRLLSPGATAGTGRLPPQPRRREHSPGMPPPAGRPTGGAARDGTAAAAAPGVLVWSIRPPLHKHINSQPPSRLHHRRCSTGLLCPSRAGAAAQRWLAAWPSCRRSALSRSCCRPRCSAAPTCVGCRLPPPTCLPCFSLPFIRALRMPLCFGTAPLQPVPSAGAGTLC